MTPSTTRHSSPAAARSGRYAVALPNDPGLDAILADPSLSSTAKALVTVMVKNWAWVKDHCWPCDKTLAAKVGKSVGQVQRCLQELEQAGRIRRERTAEVPNGRRIWLLWRHPGGRDGAQPEIAKARSAPAAPARSEPVVIVNPGMEPGIRSTSPRRRPAATPMSAAGSDPAAASTPDPPAEEPTPQPVLLPVAQEPCGTPLTAEMAGPIPPSGQASPEAAGGLSGATAPTPAPPAPANAPKALDLGAIGRPTTPAPASSRIPRTGIPASPVPSSAAAPPSAPRRKRPGLGLDLAELVQVVGATADPILAAELARRTAPPAPPERPPQVLPTAELLAKLPGRHDLIAAATHRLAEATGDFRPASWSFFRQAVEAVVTRSVPPGVLLDCHHQATGPRAKAPGKVFVAAWKREAHRRL